jgi:hypothetical protein
VREGATESGQDGPGPVGLSGPAWPTPDVGSPPPFLAPEGSSTLKPWRRRHSQRGEPFTPGGHPQAREREEGVSGGGSTISKEAPIGVLDAAVVKQRIQISELEEMRLKAYENTSIYKERIKRWYDKRR